MCTFPLKKSRISLSDWLIIAELYLYLYVKNENQMRFKPRYKQLTIHVFPTLTPLR